MMSQKASIPDAWDDDWESVADREDVVAPTPAAKEAVKISKAERLAQHAEVNRQIWTSAEEPEKKLEKETYFLATRDNVPLKSDFKPALKVLSRKPLAIENEDEETIHIVQATPDELRAKAQKEREEKQRRYDEARARILGAPTNSGATASVDEGRINRGKGRGRGNSKQNFPRSGSESGPRELYDPNYTAKPGVIQKRNGSSQSGRSTPKEEAQAFRAPRGPNGSGRGFGLADRGGKTS